MNEQQERLIRITEVEDTVGLTKGAIYGRIRRGEFPSPVRVGDRAVRWLESEIQSWIADRVREAEQDAA